MESWYNPILEHIFGLRKEILMGKKVMVFVGTSNAKTGREATSSSRVGM
jgi:hypothetical protein